jgi:hypothetical protein
MFDSTQLPQLRGSIKQIDWANTIRYKAIVDYGDRAWEAIKAVKAAATWIKHKDDIAEFLQLADNDHPRRLSSEELQELDLDKFTKTEIYDMWMVDRALYMEQVEVPWNFLLGIEID